MRGGATSLIVNAASSGMYFSPRSRVSQCCLPTPRKKILFESAGDTWKERMPDLTSSSCADRSIFQFCFSHVRPSSALRYTKFFAVRTNTVFLSLPTHWMSATGLSSLYSFTVMLRSAPARAAIASAALHTSSARAAQPRRRALGIDKAMMAWHPDAERIRHVRIW